MLADRALCAYVPQCENCSRASGPKAKTRLMDTEPVLLMSKTLGFKTACLTGRLFFVLSNTGRRYSSGIVGCCSLLDR